MSAPRVTDSQLGFFVSRPMARAEDPLSSHNIAADEYQGKGHAEIDRQRAIAAVRRWPGSSAEQLARLMCPAGDHYRTMVMLRKRLPEARERGQVRSMLVSNRLHWWPT